MVVDGYIQVVMDGMMVVRYSSTNGGFGFQFQVRDLGLGWVQFEINEQGTSDFHFL